MNLSVYTDGGAKGNPGPAAIGIAYYHDGKLLETYREDLGVATNNEAEYTAVIRALEKIKAQMSNLKDIKKITKIQFYSDSSLMVNQLNGLFKVKHSGIRELIMKIRILEQEIGIPVSYTYIPREKNTVADALVNDRYGI